MSFADPARRRAYLRDYFIRNRDKIYATRVLTGSARASEKRRRDRARQFIQDTKGVPCADCGERYPHYVMEFDHARGDKHFKVSNIPAARSRLDVLAHEISKCDVVCANCHKVRTWDRRSK